MKPKAPYDPFAITQEMPKLYRYDEILGRGAVAAVDIKTHAMVTVELDGCLLTAWHPVDEQTWVTIDSLVGDRPKTVKDLLLLAQSFLTLALKRYTGL